MAMHTELPIYKVASDYDALAQRCRELELKLAGQICKSATLAWVDKKQQRELDDCLSRGIAATEGERDTLRTDVAFLKARVLEAERAAEELVRLRAENRELLKSARRYEHVRRLNPNQFGNLCQQNIQTGERFDCLVDTAMESLECANTAGSSRET